MNHSALKQAEFSLLEKKDDLLPEPQESSRNHTNGIFISRSLRSQLLAVFIVNVMKFAFGIYTGFTTVMIPILTEGDEEIKPNIHELTWFTSPFFSIPVGALLSCLVAQYLGFRVVIMTGAVFYTISSIIFNQAYNFTMILIAQTILGFATGMLTAPCYSYIAEIMEPRYRGTLMATINLSQSFGQFFILLLGAKIYWRTAILIGIPFTVSVFLAMFFIPESPHWLLSKKRYLEAERSLAWFRGWSDHESIKSEFLNILENSEKTSKSLESKIRNKITKIDRRTRLSLFLEPYKQRIFYLPLMTVCYSFLISDLAGCGTIIIFSILVFEKFHSPIDENVASIISIAVRIVASLTCIFLIHFIGKRKLALISVCLSGISCVFVATFGFLIDYGKLESEIYKWIPTIFIIIGIYVSSAGINKIVFLMNSELFPTRLRHVGAGIGQIFSQTVIMIFNKIFLYMIEAVTIPSAYVFFAIINLIGVVSLYFILPDTDNKTLEDIERYYAGSRKSKSIESDVCTVE